MVSIYYENRIYRYQLRAMGVVMALVDEELSPPWTATIIPLKAGVPVLSVTTTAENYKRFASGELDQKSFAASLIIKDNPPSPDLSGNENASFRRIDLSAGPTFTLELEQLDDSLRSRVNIVPQIETTLAKGLLATGQLVIPVVEEIEDLLAI